MLRGTTLAGQLAAMGFADTARAQHLITEDLALDMAAADSDMLGARPTLTSPWRAWPGCRTTRTCAPPCARTPASGPG